MDTPRTNVGDATYLGRAPPDFDMTQEPSFQSPTKDNNLLQQMRNGRAVSLRTPRGSRAPLGDKRNLPTGIGGSEFTPMLKSATRNSARRRGKENTNGLATPGLGKIDEDMDMNMTNVPVESSLFGPSRHMSYVDATPLPEVDASSTTSTPMALPTRRGGANKGPLQDGNQLSLREQENVIDKIEKENFGLKLKIHFLEEAIRKNGPGYSEAALKENTELKVDKVTMQRELSKYKKHLASAEKDLETYQQQILDVQEKAKKKYADQGQRAENDALRRRLEERETEIESLRQQLQRQPEDNGEADKLRDEIGDLEADLRAKDREVNEREDEIDELKTKLEAIEEQRKAAERKMATLDEKREAEIKSLRQQLQGHSADGNEAEKLRDTIGDLEADLRAKDREMNEREDEIDELKARLEEIEDQRKVAEQKIANLERQRSTQNDAEANQLHRKISDLEADLRAKDSEVNEREDEIDELNTRLEEIEEQRKAAEQKIINLERQGSRQDDAKTDQLRRKISDLEASLREKDIDLGERDEELRTRLQEIEEQRKAAEQEIAVLKRQRSSQNDAEADQLRRKISGLEADLREKDLDLAERDEELRTKLEEIEEQRKAAEHQIAILKRQRSSQNDAEADQLRRKINALEADLREKDLDIGERDKELEELLQQRDAWENDQRVLTSKLEAIQKDLDTRTDEKNLLQLRHDTLKGESASLQRDIARLKIANANLERQASKQDETEPDQLRRQISDLEADLREKDMDLGERDEELLQEREAWENERRALASKLEAIQKDLKSQVDEKHLLELRIEALEDEVEVLQATLDEESEDANQRLREADELCRELQQKVDGSSRQESRELTRANEATEDLRRQLLRAQKDAKKAKTLCDGMRSQLDAARDDLNHLTPLCKELRQKLDRARNERAAHQASAEKMRVDCERLKEAAREALAWIQAKNAEKPTNSSSSAVAPGPIKQAAMATFRYGDVVMDVVDQKDHMTVIRSAEEARRRHEKEIRGLVLQMEWMQARFKRESKLRSDGAFAKKFLQLQLDIADAWYVFHFSSLPSSTCFPCLASSCSSMSIRANNPV